MKSIGVAMLFRPFEATQYGGFNGVRFGIVPRDKRQLLLQTTSAMA